MGLEFHYSAFAELTTCRGAGYNSEGPITWLAINEWCVVNGVWGEQREDVFHFMQVMDAAYLEHKAKKLLAAAAQHGNQR